MLNVRRSGNEPSKNPASETKKTLHHRTSTDDGADGSRFSFEEKESCIEPSGEAKFDGKENPDKELCELPSDVDGWERLSLDSKSSLTRSCPRNKDLLSSKHADSEKGCAQDKDKGSATHEVIGPYKHAKNKPLETQDSGRETIGSECLEAERGVSLDKSECAPNSSEKAVGYDVENGGDYTEDIKTRTRQDHVDENMSTMARNKVDKPILLDPRTITCVRDELDLQIPGNGFELARECVLSQPVPKGDCQEDISKMGKLNKKPNFYTAECGGAFVTLPSNRLVDEKARLGDQVHSLNRKDAEHLCLPKGCSSDQGGEETDLHPKRPTFGLPDVIDDYGASTSNYHSMSDVHKDCTSNSINESELLDTKEDASRLLSTESKVTTKISHSREDYAVLIKHTDGETFISANTGDHKMSVDEFHDAMSNPFRSWDAPGISPCDENSDTIQKDSHINEYVEERDKADQDTWPSRPDSSCTQTPEQMNKWLPTRQNPWMPSSDVGKPCKSFNPDGYELCSLSKPADISCNKGESKTHLDLSTVQESTCLPPSREISTDTIGNSQWHTLEHSNELESSCKDDICSAEMCDTDNQANKALPCTPMEYAHTTSSTTSASSSDHRSPQSSTHSSKVDEKELMITALDDQTTSPTIPDTRLGSISTMPIDSKHLASTPVLATATSDSKTSLTCACYGAGESRPLDEPPCRSCSGARPKVKTSSNITHLEPSEPPVPVHSVASRPISSDEGGPPDSHTDAASESDISPEVPVGFSSHLSVEGVEQLHISKLSHHQYSLFAKLGKRDSPGGVLNEKLKNIQIELIESLHSKDKDPLEEILQEIQTQLHNNDMSFNALEVALDKLSKSVEIMNDHSMATLKLTLLSVSDALVQIKLLSEERGLTPYYVIMNKNLEDTCSPSTLGDYFDTKISLEGKVTLRTSFVVVNSSDDYMELDIKNISESLSETNGLESTDLMVLFKSTKKMQKVLHRQRNTRQQTSLAQLTTEHNIRFCDEYRNTPLAYVVRHNETDSINCAKLASTYWDLRYQEPPGTNESEPALENDSAEQSSEAKVKACPVRDDVRNEALTKSFTPALLVKSARKGADFFATELGIGEARLPIGKVKHL